MTPDAMPDRALPVLLGPTGEVQGGEQLKDLEVVARVSFSGARVFS